MSLSVLHALLLVLAAPFALLAASGAVLFVLGQWSRHWPAVIGRVQLSALKTKRIANGLRVYWVGAKYSYYSGRARSGSWIAFAYPGTASASTFTKSKAETLLIELRPGSRIDVFVCPCCPSISVLRQGPNLSALLYVGLGLSFCGSLLWIAQQLVQA
jgi:hypothetical protein